jgi:hypothetical protein
VKLAAMSDERIEELMLDAGIIRNRLKLKARGAMPRPGWLWITLPSGCGRSSAAAEDQPLQGAAKSRLSPMKPRP